MRFTCLTCQVLVFFEKSFDKVRTRQIVNKPASKDNFLKKDGGDTAAWYQQE
jgi:hypothetical protein